jgi:DNA-binding IclR family transcriptional regulator
MEHDLGKVREVLALLDDHPEGLNITAIARNVGINRNSLAKYLDILIRDGRLEEQGFGKSRVFFRAHRLPFQKL